MESPKLIAEGKTKRILGTDEPGLVVIESKDDITAGDGAKRDTVPGKAELATRTTANVFRLLKESGLPVAFVRQTGATTFLAEYCEMLPYEVIVRREAHGSFLKRRPEIGKGHLFPRLLTEFFLKTSGKKWEGRDIPVDDPLIHFGDDDAALFIPDRPIVLQDPFLVLPNSLKMSYRREMDRIARRTFLVLEKAWQMVGRCLVDFKVEFGSNDGRELRLADVIDNDSWRVLDDRKHIDKQMYRDGADIPAVTEKYRMVADLTERFTTPRQRLILWRASESDNLDKFYAAIREIGGAGFCRTETVTGSLHKEPVWACEKIGRLVQEVPDTVVIVYCGRSNGAGPTLSAQCGVPTITVPATWQSCREDVWSSLRTPSEVPVSTILEPKNAVLAALQILSMRNPGLYAELSLRREKRLRNSMSI